MDAIKSMQHRRDQVNEAQICLGTVIAVLSSKIYPSEQFLDPNLGSHLNNHI